VKTKAKTMTTLLEGDGRVRRTREADERTNEGRAQGRVARSVSFVSSHEPSIRTHFLAGFLRFFGIQTLASSRRPPPYLGTTTRWLGSFLTDHEPSK